MLAFPTDNPRTTEFVHSYLPGCERIDKFSAMFEGNKVRIDQTDGDENATLIREILMFGLNMAIIWDRAPDWDGFVRHIVIW